MSMHPPCPPAAPGEAARHPGVPPPRDRAVVFAWRVAMLAALWVLLSGGSASSWVIGAPAVLAAAWLMPPPTPRRWRLRLAGLPQFVAFFLVGSVRGGVDVAARVLAPRLRVAPGLLRHRWALPEDGPAQPLFVLCVSLLPGTLVAEHDTQGLLVHVLDTDATVVAELQGLERAIGGLLVPVPAALPDAEKEHA